MSAKLFCKTGPLAGTEFTIDREATIGSKGDNTIVLYPKIISGKHARIFWDEEAGCYFLEDLDSRNGTELDGVRVREKEKLGSLHVITFARTFDFIFQVVEEKAARPSKPAAEGQETRVGDEFLAVPDELGGGKADAQKTVFDPELAVPPNLAEPPESSGAPDVHKTVADAEFVVPPDLEEARPEEPGDRAQRTVADAEFVVPPNLGEAPAEESASSPPTVADADVVSAPPPKPEEKKPKAAQYTLVFETLDRRFTLKSGENLVGRALDCDVCVDDPSVSRHHACITVTGSTVKLKDLKSKNHTFLNGERIRKEVEITAGDEITFGEVDATLESGSE